MLIFIDVFTSPNISFLKKGITMVSQNEENGVYQISDTL